MLLHTSKDIEAAKELIYKYRNGELPPQMTPELWRAKQVLDSTLHPDTGTPVLLPFRMSSYVLSNLVVTVGMLTPNMGTAGTLFWQIANQSLNVAVNTANANKSHPLTTQQLVTSYLLAVSGSCGVALGLNAIVPRLKNVSANTRSVLSRLVPFAAVVSAGIVNVALMRGEEIRRGISVYYTKQSKKQQQTDAISKEKDGLTHEGDDVVHENVNLGTSKRAAKLAVGETALSRVINATPVMVIPPLLLLQLQKTVLKGKSMLAVTLANLGLITVTSFAVLPFALAIFPQTIHISPKVLEEQFHDLKDEDGKPIEKVWFNRGM